MLGRNGVHKWYQSQWLRSRRVYEKTNLEGCASYSAWRTKMETIIDADDCWDIVMGTKLESNNIAVAVDEGQE